MFVANSEKPSLKRCISLGLRSAFDLVEILLWSLEVYHCDFAERSFSGILFAHPFALRTKSIWSWSVLGKLPGTGQTGNSCGFKLTHYQISQAHKFGEYHQTALLACRQPRLTIPLREGPFISRLQSCGNTPSPDIPQPHQKRAA